MAQINILHLSDLHFAKSNEIDISIIKEAFIKDIKEIHATESFTPNIILFTGDLVQSGDDNEFKDAHESWFVPLIEATGLNLDFFIISPGNHDIQRSQIDDIIESGL
jgi:3',5'-cyclic AMP phosphodiesterase CpdA